MVSNTHQPSQKVSEYHAEKVSFETLLRSSDAVSIHIPLNKTTYHLIEKNNIDKIKKNLILINTARKGIVSEEALIEGIDNQSISFAGIDSSLKQWQHSVQSRLLDPSDEMREKLIITNHSAWFSNQSVQKLQKKTAQNCLDYFINL